MNNSPTAQIIFDVPAKADAFSGKGHERSAGALAEGIDQVFEHGGGAIGLEGAWGSGKSSVIEMAEEQLRNLEADGAGGPVRYHVFAFDLWTHQTDEFRRAFLERFLDFMEHAEFDHDVDLEEQRDRIRNRKKETTNASKHRYTATGAFIVLLLPFLPLVYAWLNPTAFVNVDALKLFPWIVLVVATASFLIALVMIRDRYLKLPEEARKGLKSFPKKFARGASEFLTLTKNVAQETSVQWIRDEDPTTVEFQKTFRHIHSQAQKGPNRLVFVLDNIDRLSREAVKDAWSEMRSLLSGRPDQALTGEAQQPVVVVVPYDRHVITQALAEDQKDTDLFAKTFHRVLRVSPPLASHWVGFLQDVLREAFGGQHSEASIYSLYRLFQLRLQEENKLATPRRIVEFVNDLGSYWTQWGGTIAIEAMAVFVLLRHELEEHFAKLGKPNFDFDSYQRLSRQDELLRDLAALHFNVAPADAEEILLATPLAGALSASSPDELQRLRLVEGFERFFPRFLPGCLEGRADQPGVIAQAAMNIAALELQGPVSEDVAIQLAGYLPSVGAFDLENEERVREGLIAIVAMQPTSNVRNAAVAVKNLVEGIQEKNTETSDFDKGANWADYVTELADKMKSAVGSDEAQNFWKASFPNVGVEFALGAAYLIEDRDDFRYLSLDGKPPMSELLLALEGKIPEHPRSVRDVSKEIASGLTAEMKASLTNAVGTHLRSADVEVDAADHLIAACSHLYSQGAPDKLMRTALQKLVSDGTVLHYASKAKDVEALASGLFLLTAHYGDDIPTPAKDPHPVFGTLGPAATTFLERLIAGDFSESLIAHLARLVARSGYFGIWLGYAASQANSVFSRTVEKMIEDRHLGLVGATAATALVSNFAELKGVLGQDGMEGLVGALGEALRGKNVISDDMLFALPREFVERVQEWSPGTPLGDLVARVDAALRAITADEWEEALGSAAPEVRMLVARIDSSAVKLSAKDYLDGYKRSALNVLCGDHPAGLTPSEWNRLYHAVPKNSRKVLAQKIVTELHRKGAKREHVGEFIANYADLAASLPLETYPETAIQILLRELVLSEDDTAENYVRENMNRFVKAIATLQEKRSSDAAAGEAISTLEDAVTSLEGSEAKADMEWAAELRETLNLPAAEPSEPAPPAEAEPGEGA